MSLGPAEIASPIKHFAQILAGDLAFGHDPVIQQQDGRPPVVEIVQPVVGVDIGQLRLMSQPAQERQRFVAEVATATRDQ